MIIHSAFNGLSSLLSGTARATAPALALAMTLGSSACGDDTAVDPVAPPGPAPLNTVASTDLTLEADGCHYGSASYLLERPERPYGVLVAAQTLCPAGFAVDGACDPLFRYPESDSWFYRTPLLNEICFQPQLTSDRGIEPCQVGALVCAVSAPGDTTETTTEYGGDGEQITSTEIINGPDGIELNLLFRCCPNP